MSKQIFQLTANNTPALTDLLAFSNEALSHQSDATTLQGVMNAFAPLVFGQVSVTANTVLTGKVPDVININMASLNQSVTLPPLTAENGAYVGKTIKVYNPGNYAANVNYSDGNPILSGVNSNNILYLTISALGTPGTVIYQNKWGSFYLEDKPSWYAQGSSTVLANLGGCFAGGVLNISTDTTLTYPLPSRVNVNTNGGSVNVTFPAFNLTKCAIGQPVELVNVGSVVGHLINPIRSDSQAFHPSIDSGQIGLFRISGAAPDTLDPVRLGSLSSQDSSNVIITNLQMLGTLTLAGDAVLALQAVTYQQLQAVIAGFTPRLPCYVATTANLNATYNNGASGVGATLTLNINGAFTADGITPPLNSRIFALNETTAAQNGIYILTTAGNVSTPAVLTRATDFNSSSNIINGAFSGIENGTTYGGTTFYLATAGAITVGTTALNFSQFGFTVAGTGLTNPLPNTLAIANTGVSAGSYGSASQSVSFTVNAQGQLTSASANNIAITTAQIIDAGAANGAATLDGSSYLKAAQFPALTGDITTIAGSVATTLATVITANTAGNAGSTLSLTWDAKGRLTNVVSNAISISQAQVTGLILSLAACLQSSNNLSDVGSASAARTNLGLGSAATQNSSAFAQVANNLSDLANASTARSNLGLGTAATQNTGVFAQVANNLSDLANAGTARTNLGLGNSAVKGVSDNTQTNVVSAKGSFTAGHILTAADTSGTVQDGGATSQFEASANKDASGGYVGLTLLKIDFKNALNTFTSFLTNANTAARTYTFQDRDGTIADNTDLAGKQPLASQLTTLAAYNTNGLFVQTAAGAYTGRSLAAGSSKVSITNADGTAGNPTIDIVTTNITTLGTIAAGTWQGTVIGAQYGGTGINNSSNTITLGGSILTAGAHTLSGAFASTFTFTATTSVTFPTSGVLATAASGTFTVNISGAFTASNVTFNYTLSGGIVVLSAGNNALATGTIAASTINFTAIPANLRPARIVDLMVRVEDGTAVQNSPGLLRINTDGTMTCFKDMAGDNFTASGSATTGITNLNVSYSVN